jgi:hypothetical protein
MTVISGLGFLLTLLMRDPYVAEVASSLINIKGRWP